MRVVCDSQRNEAWFNARLGKLTASKSGAILSRYASEKKKAEDTAERYGYKAQVATERLTGKVTQAFRSVWMEEGNAYEDDARAAYELKEDGFVDQTGFVLHPRYDYFGASPDGLLPNNGVLEIKVPAPWNHFKYLDGKLDPVEEYGAQMLGEIICCEADYVVFASYNPDFPPDLKLFTKRYERGDILQIHAYEQALEQFEAEVSEMVSRHSRKRVTASEPSPEELAAQDMRDLEATWK